jgi:hypothetical protein
MYTPYYSVSEEPGEDYLLAAITLGMPGLLDTDLSGSISCCALWVSDSLLCIWTGCHISHINPDANFFRY